MADELFDIVSTPKDGSPEGSGGNQVDTSIVVRLHVQPGAGRSVVVGRRGNALHIRVAPPPANGLANTAAEVLLSDLFDVPKSKVKVVAGHKSRDKRIQVDGVALDLVRSQIAHAIAETPPVSTHNQGRIRPQH